MPSALELLTEHSTATNGSTAWEHLNAQEGGGGELTLTLFGDDIVFSSDEELIMIYSDDDSIKIFSGDDMLQITDDGDDVDIDHCACGLNSEI